MMIPFYYYGSSSETKCLLLFFISVCVLLCPLLFYNLNLMNVNILGVSQYCLY